MMFSGCWRVSDEASKVSEICPVSKRVVFISNRPPGTLYMRAPLYDHPLSAEPGPLISPSLVQVESPSVERRISILASEAVKCDAVN